MIRFIHLFTITHSPTHPLTLTLTHVLSRTHTHTLTYSPTPLHSPPTPPTHTQEEDAMDCLFKEQEDGLGGMDPFEEGFEEEPEPEPEWADSDIEEVLPTVTTQSKRNLLFEVR